MNKFLILLLYLLPVLSSAQYTGTGSVTHGPATTVTTNLYTCTGGRVAGIGTITATDNTVWIVPAEVNFTNSSFPFASDLYNSCNGLTYPNAAAALAALNGTDILDIDSGGELITAYIFADNYFEMYINGTPVGKDNVPYTQFNSNIIRFRVNRPFTIAMLLVDWEEHLGLGSENSNGFAYHDGDGGMVAVFKDASNNIIAITGNAWNAQTFYTAPITDLNCPSENGSLRLSNNCSTHDTTDGSGYYGLHWAVPAGWMNASFNDSAWPAATTYTNATIGVNNKPAYTNFTNIFDDPAHDAEFIWSTNVILDNEVIVRYTVQPTTSIFENSLPVRQIHVFPNPATDEFYLDLGEDIHPGDIRSISLYNSVDEKIYDSDKYSGRISLRNVPCGLYIVNILVNNYQLTQKLMVE